MKTTRRSHDPPPSGTVKYVQSKNPQAAGLRDPTFDVYKTAVIKPNSGEQRVRENTREFKHDRNSPRETHLPLQSAQSRAQPGGPPFYGTDGSVADDFTNDSVQSAEFQHQAPHHYAGEESAASDSDIRDDRGSEGNGSDDDEQAELPAAMLPSADLIDRSKLSRGALDLMGNIELNFHSRTNGYTTTASGPASVSEVHAKRTPALQDQEQSHPFKEVTARQRPPQSAKSGAQVARQDGTQHALRTAASNIVPLMRDPRGAPRLTDSRPDTASLVNQAGSVAKPHRIQGSTEPMAPPTKPAQRDRSREVHRQPLPISVINNIVATATSRPQAQVPQGNEDYGEAEQHQESSYNAQQRSSQTELEYEYDDLCKMEYSDVKAQKFDFAPCGHKLELREDFMAMPLSDKLKAYAALPNNQIDFFATLDIEEWEEAGDWFLERFSETVNELRIARGEKRKVAREFEAEIEQRQMAVDRKRKLVESALGDMKMNGMIVLQKTPKKAKRSA